MKVRCSYIFVNWASSKMIWKSVASLVKYVDISSDELIIVDNFSDQEEVNHLKNLNFETFPFNKIKIVYNPENSGFGRGCNLGFQNSHGAYVVLVNPDTEFSGDVIPELINHMDQKCGMISPAIVDKNGSKVLSPAVDPNPFNLLLFGPGVDRILSRINCKGRWSIFVDLDSQSYPDWVIGAFMMLPRDVFAEVDGFDESFFMYYEEADLCRRIRALGYRILYYPEVSVMHIGGGSCTKIPILSINRRVNSELLYLKKWYGLLVARITLLIGAFVASLKGITKLALGSFSKKLSVEGKSDLYFALFRIKVFCSSFTTSKIRSRTTV
ncbi:glycosyltransferase family 2 protein [Candidatus Dojkabacteria bacterium]|nr:glycosyltransferase family 2 protein [Candidatus Dojkabacteria bacterium]